MKNEIIIRGKVKEVRIFGGNVIVFITATTPQVHGKKIRYTVNATNCDNQLKWAELPIGAEVTIRQSCDNPDTPSDCGYVLLTEKSDVVRADNYLQLYFS